MRLTIFKDSDRPWVQKGSVLAYPDTLNKTVDDSVYQVEGIGYASDRRSIEGF
jgi:hypothetical protein